MAQTRSTGSPRPRRRPDARHRLNARYLDAALAVWRMARAAIELPRGTVTFLFTDVEGSTRLVTAVGDRYPQLLAAHHRVLRHAIAAHGGCEVGTHGDAFFVAFARARDALAAAVAAQRALAAVAWPEGIELRVRMGLHTGEAAVQGTTYVGLDVHRAARICSAAHGGQVLVSRTTRELVAGGLPGDHVMLRDLGPRALRDLVRPEHLFEVVAADGARDVAAEQPAAAAAAR